MRAKQVVSRQSLPRFHLRGRAKSRWSPSLAIADQLQLAAATLQMSGNRVCVVVRVLSTVFCLLSVVLELLFKLQWNPSRSS